MRVILLDGDWNLKRNIMARQELFVKGDHCGGSYGFLESLKAVLNKTMVDRCIVMWDGMHGGKLRHDFYPAYKENRNKSWDEEGYFTTDLEVSEEERKNYSALAQKVKVKNYLEDLFVRQVETDLIEGDDLIAQYVKSKSPDEEIIIFSTDRDYQQLIGEGVSVLRPSDKNNSDKIDLITKDNFKTIFGYTIENALILRCFEGDTSDNIAGVDGIAIKTILKHFPRFVDEEYTIDRFIQESVELYSKKKLKVFEKIIGSRRTIERNKKLMDLKNPFVTEEAIEHVRVAQHEAIISDNDFTNRSIDTAMKSLISDGFNKHMWQENVEYFIRPFYRLVSKEKEFAKKLLEG